MEERQTIENLLVDISKIKEETIDDLFIKLDMINRIIKLLLKFSSSKNVVNLDIWCIDTLNKMSRKRNSILSKIHGNIKKETNIYVNKKTQS